MILLAFIIGCIFGAIITIFSIVSYYMLSDDDPIEELTKK